MKYVQSKPASAFLGAYYRDLVLSSLAQRGDEWHLREEEGGRMFLIWGYDDVHSYVFEFAIEKVADGVTVKNHRSYRFSLE